MTDPTTPPQPQPAPQDPQAGAQAASASGANFVIPQVVLDKYPDLVELIKKSESMSNEEREYWFQILPIMTEDQVKRLRTILEEESKQLAQLDAQYKDEVSKLNQKHLAEWDNFERQKERETRVQAEAQAEEQEKSQEENILGKLDNL